MKLDGMPSYRQNDISAILTRYFFPTVIYAVSCRIPTQLLLTSFLSMARKQYSKHAKLACIESTGTFLVASTNSSTYEGAGVFEIHMTSSSILNYDLKVVNVNQKFHQSTL